MFKKGSVVCAYCISASVSNLKQYFHHHRLTLKYVLYTLYEIFTINLTLVDARDQPKAEMTII